MTIASKVWLAGEREPDGLFDPALCPAAPPNWFREETAYAAELYALERYIWGSGEAKYDVCVLDTKGVRRSFMVRIDNSLAHTIRETTHA